MNNELPPLVPGTCVLRDGPKRSALLRSLVQRWGIPVQGEPRFPGPQPVSLARCHLERVCSAQTPYVATKKSDGTRFLLYLGTHGASGTPFAVMIDRAMTVFEVAVEAPSLFFHGSIFDGELLWELEGSLRTLRQVFHVFDVVALRGSNAISREPYDRRLQLVRTCFYAVPRNVHDPETRPESAVLALGNRHGLAFVPKEAVPVVMLDVLLRRETYHACDGLLFTPLAEPVRSGRHKTQYKWKEDHTLDFRIGSAASDALAYMAAERGEVTTASCALCYRGLPLHVFRSEDELPAEYVGHVGEFTCTVPLLNAAAGHYVSTASLLRIRSDKATPNDRETLERTFATLDECITVDDILATISAQHSF